MKLIMTQGLPASGKSTWAREQVRKSGGQTKRVNKDDLRDMLDDGKWSKGNEKEVLKVRDNLVINFLSDGFSVIVDDTNLAEKHENTLREIAKACGAQFEIKSFLDVSLKTCIERDLARPKSVGERVIKSMFNQWLRPAAEPPVHDLTLPSAIICDIDGTLAHMNGRGPYDWDKVGEDKLDRVVAHILETYRAHYQNNADIGADMRIILLSGRDGVCREITEQWLETHQIQYDELHMRAAGDMRKDNIVKRELYEEHIAGKYNVEFVLDDRDQVVDMWRNELGLKVLQVAEGDF